MYSALAPARKADVSRRSAFSQSTPVLSPPGDCLADIAYGVLGRVLAEVGSPWSEFSLACVPAWAQRFVVPPFTISESFSKVLDGAVGGEPGVADVFPQQALLAVGRVQSNLVSHYHHEISIYFCEQLLAPLAFRTQAGICH